MLQPFLMTLGRVLLLTAALALSLTRVVAEELRFSATLGAADRTASGFAKLTSDQVAVIDALVRRDTVSRGGTPAPTGEKVATVFSQRITAGERTTAGLPTLSATELAQLDAFVERHQAAKLARTLLAPPSYVARNSRMTPTEKKKEREIHGSFSLSYGMGSGGYSEKSGAMVLTMEDPARGLSISFGYSETHVKGGYGVYRDPFYDSPRHLSPDDPFRP